MSNSVSQICAYLVIRTRMLTIFIQIISFKKAPKLLVIILPVWLSKAIDTSGKSSNYDSNIDRTAKKKTT
jgi:hypothetical protein